MGRLAGVRKVLAAGCVGALWAALAYAAPAAADSGPPLTVPASALRAALRCTPDLATAGREPVLLLPGTTLTPQVEYSWGYQRAFAASGRPYCAVTLPGNAMADIQIAGEYVVYALRFMHKAASRKIQLVGFSQGGMVPRWALKFWPDTRAVVDDLVSLDASNHGTLDVYPVCAVGCAPAFFQQQTGSHFLAALNADAETFPGIAYTQIFTSVVDEVVVPNLGPFASSSLHTGGGQIANISVQDICPVHVADHLTMGTADPIGYALVLDALGHAGTARPARISRSVCTQLFMPGVDLLTFTTNFAAVGATAGQQLLSYPHVPSEPPLRPYAT
jgi:hypothetical protein